MIKTAVVILLIISCAFGELIPTITLERDHVNLGFEKVKLNWQIENTDSHPVLLLKFGTPLEGTHQNTLTSNMFQIVSENGVSPIYTGILVKRASPTKDDYEIIQGNSVVSGEIILTDAYHFFEDSTYTVQLTFSRSNLLETYPLSSNVVTLKVSGSQPFEFQKPDMFPVDYKGCTTARTDIVSTAITNAQSASNGALNYLNNGCQPTYVTWFGLYSSSNYNIVQSHFQSIYSALASNNFGIDCNTCTLTGTYAYVYPSDPTKTIYLCDVFWQTSPNPYTYDSQPGTLTHEMSHFTAVAGTQDYQYGTAGCLNLAKTNPSRAIMNADSHEYFQESGPTC